MAFVTSKTESLKYDGTNSATVVAWLTPAATVVTETASNLRINYQGDLWDIPRGGYVLRGAQGRFAGSVDAATYADSYYELP